MKTILLSNVVVKPGRQRQEFNPEALQELKVSIEYDPAKANCQLQHAPVLRAPTADDKLECPEIDFKGKMVLTSGERRCKAIDEIFELGGSFLYDGTTFTAEDGLIPYVTMGDLSPLEAEEAELDENLKRKPLTWQEHAAAVKRLHDLRTAQFKNAQIVKQAEVGLTEAEIGKTYTVADTAEELTGRRDGSYQDTVRKEILVAKHLDNPAVAKAKSAEEAFKILKKEEEKKRNIAHAAVIGASFNSDQHRLFNMDCLTFMQDPANHNYFDVICTDPPYGMGAQEFGDGGGKFTGIEHHYDDSYESWQALMKAWCPLSFQVTKPMAHAYVFCDFDRFHELKQMMIDAGWYVFRTPLVVHKINSGRVPLPEHGPRRQYELVLYAIKGKKPVTHIYPDVVSVQGDDNMSHGAQKPVALLQNLLQRSVRAGDKVADFFAGTGGIIPAGHTYKCEVTAIEKTPEYYAIAARRLEEVKQNDQLGLDLGA